MLYLYEGTVLNCVGEQWFTCAQHFMVYYPQRHYSRPKETVRKVHTLDCVCFKCVLTCTRTQSHCALAETHIWANISHVSTQKQIDSREEGKRDSKMWDQFHGWSHDGKINQACWKMHMSALHMSMSVSAYECLFNYGLLENKLSSNTLFRLLLDHLI